MKKLRLLFILSLAGFTLIFIYANTRTVSPTEKIKAVRLISYSLHGVMLNEDRMQLQDRIKEIPGVTACAIGKDNLFASIIFHPDQVEEADFTFALNRTLPASKINWQTSASGGCPIPKINSSLNSLFSLFDLRN